MENNENKANSEEKESLWLKVLLSPLKIFGMAIGAVLSVAIAVIGLPLVGGLFIVAFTWMVGGPFIIFAWAFKGEALVNGWFVDYNLSKDILEYIHLGLMGLLTFLWVSTFAILGGKSKEKKS